MSEMMAPEKVITVFGSSRPHEGDADYEQARALGRALGERRWKVCSGGYGGVMEGVSRGAKEVGGSTLGITAEVFQSHANRWGDDEIHVGTREQMLFVLICRGGGFLASKCGTASVVEPAIA